MTNVSVMHWIWKVRGCWTFWRVWRHWFFDCKLNGIRTPRELFLLLGSKFSMCDWDNHKSSKLFVRILLSQCVLPQFLCFVVTAFWLSYSWKLFVLDRIFAANVLSVIVSSIFRRKFTEIVPVSSSIVIFVLVNIRLATSFNSTAHPKKRELVS